MPLWIKHTETAFLPNSDLLKDKNHDIRNMRTAPLLQIVWCQLKTGTVLLSCETVRTVPLSSRSFLKYVRDPKNMPEGEKTELVKKIDEIVEFANHNAEWRRDYMTYRQMQLDAKNEGENLLATLMRLLFDANRLDDAKQATINPVRRNELYREFGLVRT